MSDTRDLLIQAIEKRLAEIEDKLDPFNALIEERAELLRVLRRHRPEQSRQLVAHGSLWRERTSLLGDRGAIEPLDAKPSNGASATSIVIAEARHVLDQTKRGSLKFARLFEQLPESAKSAFKGKYRQQAVKTAIQRSGNKVGIEYKKGGTVRIIPTAPEQER